jgi:hypothetical protein
LKANENLVTKIFLDFCSSSNFEENSNDLEVPVAEKTEEVDEPVVAIDLFSDLDPRSMFKRF